MEKMQKTIMNRRKFRQLIQSIFAVKDQEIICSEFFDILPRFVDLQVSGKDVDKSFPGVSHHLQQCPECNEVYEALFKAAQSDNDTDKT
jgi:hypothetical protein